MHTMYGQLGSLLKFQVRNKGMSSDLAPYSHAPALYHTLSAD